LLFDRGRIENVASPEFKLEMATNTVLQRQDCTKKTPRRQCGGESVSQLPLKDKAFLTFLGRNPPFELLPEAVVSPSIFHEIRRGSSKYWPNPAISVGGGQQGWSAFALRRQRSPDRVGAPVFLYFTAGYAGLA
jgi:hypothetical protein